MSFASIRFASFSPSSSLPYVFSLFLHSLSFFYALLSCLPPVVLLTVTYPLSFVVLSFLPPGAVHPLAFRATGCKSFPLQGRSNGRRDISRGTWPLDHRLRCCNRFSASCHVTSSEEDSEQC